MTESLAGLERQVDEILRPLREVLRRIDGEIEAHQQKVRELKEARATPARVLAAAERTVGVAAKPGPKTVGAAKVSEDKLDKLEEWLRAHVDGQPFYATELVNRDDFDVIPSQTSVSRALILLSERGSIRLDSKGIGGRKIYKLVGER